ncbi:MAG: GntR family transcriptional regulator [Planctomycetota bacterium]
MSQTRSQPKYVQIAESLARAIQTGRLNPGDRLASDDELAEEFNASRNTVVRALGQLRDNGLIERIQGAGTYVAELSKKTGQRYLFIGDGHFHIDARDTVFGRLEASIDMLLRSQYDGLLELDRPLDEMAAEHKAKAVDLAIENKYDGCFFMPIEARADSMALNQEMLSKLTEAGIHVVLIDQDFVPHPDRSRYDLVSLDHVHAGLTVGRHLAAKSAKKMLMLVPKVTPFSVARRCDGLRTAIGDDAQLEVVPIEGYNEQSIYKAIEANKPDAIIGKDDRMAATAMRVLYQQQRRVPDEVMICGFDDATIASSLPVPLTSYRQPVSEIAQMAINLMIDRLSNPQRPTRQIIVSGELVERESTDRKA